jgi:hypothetical protein
MIQMESKIYYYTTLSYCLAVWSLQATILCICANEREMDRYVNKRNYRHWCCKKLFEYNEIRVSRDVVDEACK